MDPCHIQNPSTGDFYREISCIYPQLAPLYPVKEELGHDPFPVLETMRSIPWAPWLAIAVYGVSIYAGKIIMDDRKSLGWRNTMALWNLGLAIFSFIGTIRLLPYSLHILFNNKVQDVFCHDARATFAGGSTGLWVQLFALSKFPELIDTFFIIIHKKPLIFLHWYHHMSVIIMSWSSYTSEQPLGIHFCLMNYFIHSVMYFYYFLMAFKMRPKWFNPMIITFFQVAQMFVGFFTTLSGFYYKSAVPNCKLNATNMAITTFIYGSYLLLFCQFFVKRYFVKFETKRNGLLTKND